MSDFSEQPSGLHDDADDQRARRRRSRYSLTRLVVGGVLLGLDELAARLPLWEERGQKILDTSADPSESTVYLLKDPDAGQEYESEDTGSPQTRLPPQSDFISQDARYALIGLAFRSASYLEFGFKTLAKASIVTWNYSRPLRSLLNIPGTEGLSERLVERGESTVQEWIEIGRREDNASRAVALAAVKGTIDETIGEIAVNPEVQDLVLHQSTGIAQTMLTEVRSRTYSADTLIDLIFQTIFGVQEDEVSPEILSAVLNNRQGP
jgi:hypothetical protein